ncbi:CapA family protein [Paenibacillus hodogayensis]|uniref:CapA family protein n=1 Tax=Paenibacillus hodogayensis TaxID=279208 RepID=A0ABV5VQZ5_9BACL
MNPHFHLKNTLYMAILIVLFAVAGCSRPDTSTKPPATAEPTTPPSSSTGPLSATSPDSQPNDDSGLPRSPDDHTEKVYRAKLAAVGDVLIHSSVYKDARTADGYDFRPMFEPVKRYIEEADIALANQESMIGGEELGLSDYPRFNGPYEVGDAVKDCGFDVVNLANNHTLDRGIQAVVNTIQHYSQLGLLYTGAYLSPQDRGQIRTLEKNGITFALLSYTYGTNGIPVPEGKTYMLNLIDLPAIRKDVVQARSLADVVVVSFHFGQEYADMPNDEQKTVARAAAEAGADIIIGHHPHVLQPAEWIQTADGRRTFVVYSLGNFIAAQEGNRERTGGIMQLTIEKTVKDGTTHLELKEPCLIPTWIHMVNWRQYKIEPLRTAEDSQLPHKSAYWDEIVNHMKQWMPELLIPAD